MNSNVQNVEQAWQPASLDEQGPSTTHSQKGSTRKVEAWVGMPQRADSCPPSTSEGHSHQKRLLIIPQKTKHHSRLQKQVYWKLKARQPHHIPSKAVSKSSWKLTLAT